MSADLEALAAQFGLVHVEGHRGWPGEIFGAVEGGFARLKPFFPFDAVPIWGFCGPFHPELNLGLQIERAPWSARLRSWVGFGDLQTGDKAFDRRFWVTPRDSDAVRSLMTMGVRGAITRADDILSIVVDDFGAVALVNPSAVRGGRYADLLRAVGAVAREVNSVTREHPELVAAQEVAPEVECAACGASELEPLDLGVYRCGGCGHDGGPGLGRYLRNQDIAEIPEERPMRLDWARSQLADARLLAESAVVCLDQAALVGEPLGLAAKSYRGDTAMGADDLLRGESELLEALDHIDLVCEALRPLCDEWLSFEAEVPEVTMATVERVRPEADRAVAWVTHLDRLTGRIS